MCSQACVCTHECAFETTVLDAHCASRDQGSPVPFPTCSAVSQGGWALAHPTFSLWKEGLGMILPGPGSLDLGCLHCICSAPVISMPLLRAPGPQLGWVGRRESILKGSEGLRLLHGLQFAIHSFSRLFFPLCFHFYICICP